MSDRHEWLDEALRLAAAEDARTIVPAGVEMRVMRAWDEREATGEATRGYRSKRAAWIAAAGVAAACAAGLVLLPPLGETQLEGQPGTPKSPAQREAIGTPGAAVDVAGATTPGTPVIESLQVVRVRMSRTAFASLGVPIENPDADGLMEVEMIVGDDGVARSIRRATFVSVADEGGER